MHLSEIQLQTHAELRHFSACLHCVGGFDVYPRITDNVLAHASREKEAIRQIERWKD